MLFVTFLLLLPAGIAAQNMSLTEALVSQNSTLSTLISLLSSQPELTQALSTATDFTLLAPSNDAFTKFLSVPANKAAANDSNILRQVLQYHVLKGSFHSTTFTSTPKFIPSMLMGTSSNASSQMSLSKVSGGQVVSGMTMDGKVVVLSGLEATSIVQTPDITFTGGIVHIVDTVLTIPPPVSTSALANNLTSLAGALTSTNLLQPVDSLPDVTIFAPSNAAFAAISSIASTLTTEQLATVLEYHVINGTVAYSSVLTSGPAKMTFSTLSGGVLNVMVEDGKVFVNSAQVITTDIIVANGVVHVLDNVINPNNATAQPDLSVTPQPIAFPAPASSAAAANSAAPTATAPVPSVPAEITSSAPAATTPKPTATNRNGHKNCKHHQLFCDVQGPPRASEVARRGMVRL